MLKQVNLNGDGRHDAKLSEAKDTTYIGEVKNEYQKNTTSTSCAKDGYALETDGYCKNSNNFGSGEWVEEKYDGTSSPSSCTMRRPLPALLPQLDIHYLSDNLWIIRRIADCDLLSYASQYNGTSERKASEVTSRMCKSLSQDASFSQIRQEVIPANRCSYTDLFMLSRSNEPAHMKMDISTGHLILSYMEEHLKDHARLDADWKALEAYEPEEAVTCEAATRPVNQKKNRTNAPLPFEHTCVRLRGKENDYINASLICDHEPRSPVYICTPTPMACTVSDFWQMVWDQNCLVMVMLDNPESLVQSSQLTLGSNPEAQVQYWPQEGSGVFDSFEVYLVSEHTWCEDYMVRSFYLKNLATSETRTLTQFHYMTWPDPHSRSKSALRSVLEFRRKVNKSFRGRINPIVIHCCDGSGRTGTYLLLDLVLSRISKGVKEIDIAASLEHLRDQRQGMVSTKEQFEFVLTAIAEEVNSILKANN